MPVAMSASLAALGGYGTKNPTSPGYAISLFSYDFGDIDLLYPGAKNAGFS
jgi:hypothetical protein